RWNWRVRFMPFRTVSPRKSGSGWLHRFGDPLSVSHRISPKDVLVEVRASSCSFCTSPEARCQRLKRNYGWRMILASVIVPARHSKSKHCLLCSEDGSSRSEIALALYRQRSCRLTGRAAADWRNVNAISLRLDQSSEQSKQCFDLL